MGTPVWLLEGKRVFIPRTRELGSRPEVRHPSSHWCVSGPELMDGFRACTLDLNISSSAGVRKGRVTRNESRRHVASTESKANMHGPEKNKVHFFKALLTYVRTPSYWTHGRWAPALCQDRYRSRHSWSSCLSRVAGDRSWAKQGSLLMAQHHFCRCCGCSFSPLP